MDWATMMTVEVPRHGLVALDEDDERARYEAVDRLTASRPADGAATQLARVRALVEVQRRCGGMAPRAVVGGEFVVGAGAETIFEVSVGAGHDALVADGHAGLSAAIPGRLSAAWPFFAGLPAEFAASTLRGLVDSSCAGSLPPGTLIVDRAAFDEVESAGPVFAQASAALCCALAAKLHGLDVNAELRVVMGAW
jgi:hypothetical protein